MSNIEPTFSALNPSGEESAGILVLETKTQLSPDARAAHLRRRKELESVVLSQDYGVWFTRVFDAGRLLRFFLRMTGLRRYAERNMLAIDLHTLTLEFPNLPDAFHGFTVLHLADLHIDSHPGLAAQLSRVLNTVEADICLITGDYRFGVVESSDLVPHYLREVISRVRSRVGIIGIMGNHDATEDVDTLERLGVRVLLNEAVEVRKGTDSLWVAGVDDPDHFQLDDTARAMRSVPEGAFTLFLSHTPSLYELAEEHSVDLFLCGHTHGGQVCFPIIGPVITKTNVARKYVSGHWTHGGMTGYTSRGIGVSGAQARFNCPPEVTLIELRKTGR